MKQMWIKCDRLIVVWSLSHYLQGKLYIPSEFPSQQMVDDRQRFRPHQLLSLIEVSFNAAISACEKGKMWQQTLDLWQRMCCNESDVLQPDLITYNALLSWKRFERWRIDPKEVVICVFLPGRVLRVQKKWTIYKLCPNLSQIILTTIL